MKTTHYNPSTLEVEFSNAIVALKAELDEKIRSNEIIDIKVHNDDNPRLVFYLKDSDGDEHEIVMKIIQRQDK